MTSKKKKKKLGLVVNPIAGLGGRVGLKGTDGIDTVEKAKLLGAFPESQRRTAEALRIMFKIKDDIELFTYPFEMGENTAKQCGFLPEIIGTIKSGKTTSADTIRAAQDMKRAGVDLLLFVGGDGTAKDIHRAIGRELTTLGVPAGVKMHSAVFGTTPRSAGEAAVAFLSSEVPLVTDAEVMDIDEASFRRGLVVAKLYGYLQIPKERHYTQNVKSGGFQTEKQVIQGIAADLKANNDKDCLYVYGPGTTTRDILAQFGLDKTLLGVDVVLGDELIARDVSESQLASLIDRTKNAKIVITVIGQQGYIFGRGNQQLSSEIIKRVGRNNIVIVASKEKLASLEGRPLLVDSGSQEVDKLIRGYVRVITGYNDYVMYRVSS